MLKVIRIFFVFELECYTIGLKNPQPFVIQSEVKTNTHRDSLTDVFPRFASVLIGSMDSL